MSEMMRFKGVNKPTRLVFVTFPICIITQHRIKHPQNISSYNMAAAKVVKKVRTPIEAGAGLLESILTM